MELIAEKILELDNADSIMKIYGRFDENVKEIEKKFNVRILSRENSLKLIGEEKNIDKALDVLTKLNGMINDNMAIDQQSLSYLIDIVEKGEKEDLESLKEIVCYTARGKKIMPKTLGQKNYIKAIEKNEIVFGIGPAGTGKTYLAMAMAIKAFKREEVNRIILTRPAVEAGESLGFLPGDLQEKVDPYLRPLYDALYDILGPETYLKYREKGLIEVAPLAYMRGRTLDDSFIILDEAQNTTPEQMKMFLTRLGFGSKAVVTGDITQIDLPGGRSSGLVKVTQILNDIEGIAFINFTQRDVVRHRLVQKIINAYESYENKKSIKTSGDKNKK
ncbi:PhoH family protein [Alkalibacter saccharofermentans]|uniref:PhoH-like protein n=1 Tax=Alkalibacter saccharofermentans DSM 14828 TaxID=1120975 RepID=A0A1M4XFT9_9FIRM|nr:phosphate starvation-inducible protein PhoH [Alkalibacter saccharofermentans DSM 14828]